MRLEPTYFSKVVTWIMKADEYNYEVVVSCKNKFTEKFIKLHFLFFIFNGGITLSEQ